MSTADVEKEAVVQAQPILRIDLFHSTTSSLPQFPPFLPLSVPKKSLPLYYKIADCIKDIEHEVDRGLKPSAAKNSPTATTIRSGSSSERVRF